jgi:hypothetical protein
MMPGFAEFVGLIFFLEALMNPKDFLMPHFFSYYYGLFDISSFYNSSHLLAQEMSMINFIFTHK